MTLLPFLLAGCAYELELADTGIVSVGSPVMALSTYEVAGPEAVDDGLPPDWGFEFEILNPGEGTLSFPSAAVSAVGLSMCLTAGSPSCPDGATKGHTGGGGVGGDSGAPAPSCATVLSLEPLPAGCTQPIAVQVEVDAPLGLVRVEGRHDEAPGLARDFVQELVVRPSAWPAPRLLSLVDAGLEVPFATSGRVDLSWELVNDGTVPVTLEGIVHTCDAYVDVSSPSGVVLEPGDRLPLAGGWDYAAGLTECTLTFGSDAGPVEGRVRMAPEAWLGEPGLRVTDPAPGATVDSTAALVVKAELTDPQSERAWSASLSASGGSWAVLASRVGPGELSFTVPAGTIGAGATALRVQADEGRRRVVASVPLVVDGAAAGSDADGWTTPDGDCDDADATTYPGAAELPDGRDNDCDGGVDEDTTAHDDDGDGQSEADGDHDDTDPRVYTGAPERCDGLDNDGDDVVDETTACADDDGDGWADVEGDCDDDEPAVHPGALDHCDDDRDCDDQERACAWTSSVYVVGVGIDDDVCVGGQTLDVEVYAWGADAVAVGTDSDAVAYEATDLLHGQLTCPVREDSAVDVTVYALASNDDGRQSWVSGEFLVLPEGFDLDAPITTGAARAPWCGCQAMTLAGAGLGVLALIGWGLRRR